MEKSIKNIWEHLSDEISKKIFSLRYMYFLTEDDSFMREIALTIPEAMNIYNRLKKSGKKKLIFGAGIWGEGILRSFNDIYFECFIDNYRDEKDIYEFAGKKVISFEEYLSEYKDDIVIISSRVYNKQIYQQLIENGISKENIINIGEINDYLNEKQYFDLPQLKEYICEKESFVDVGCLDGRSSFCFSRWCEGKYNKIYAVEPDEYNRKLCNKGFFESNIINYEIIDKGLWNEKALLEFKESKNGLSKLVTTGGNTKIQVDRLDNMINERVTFIKMDIEGAEYNALCGCKQIIKKYKPKLAICIYHKPEDIIQIPSLILSFNEKYKFYIRHYSTTWSESVLYAL